MNPLVSGASGAKRMESWLRGPIRVKYRAKGAFRAYRNVNGFLWHVMLKRLGV